MIDPIHWSAVSGVRKDRRITESQNHRMVGVGRDLCGSSSPTLLPKQGHLQQAAQDCYQTLLEHGTFTEMLKHGSIIPTLHLLYCSVCSFQVGDR